MEVNAISSTFPGIVNEIITDVLVSNPITGEWLKTKAIWDTGATSCVITNSAASKLNLPVISKATVHGVHGDKEVNVHYVNLKLNNENIELTNFVTVCDELSPDGTIGVLIGMDLITKGDLCITNHSGQTVMTFRVPSIETVNFVREIEEEKKYFKIHESWKAHGDHRCPCGSGKKYENCHGKSKYHF